MLFHSPSLIWQQAGDVIIKVVAGFPLLTVFSSRRNSQCLPAEEMNPGPGCHQFPALPLWPPAPPCQAGKLINYQCALRRVGDLGMEHTGADHCSHPAQTLLVPVAFPPALLRCRGAESCLQDKSFVNRWFFSGLESSPSMEYTCSIQRKWICSDFKGNEVCLPCETSMAPTTNIAKYI